MSAAIQYLKKIAFLAIVCAFIWWWTGLYSQTISEQLVDAGTLAVMYLITLYIPQHLNFRWRIAGVALLLVAAIFAFRNPHAVSRILPDGTVLAFAIGFMALSLMFPNTPRSKMSAWAAWRYLRTSRAREEEAAN